MAKPLVAEQQMKEFDPECERHMPLLIVKAVDPGCTLELQVENVVNGQITRLTSTESVERDMASFEQVIIAQFRLAWKELEAYRAS